MAMGTVEQVLWPDALPDANLPRVAFYDTPNMGRIWRIYSPVMLAQSAGHKSERETKKEKENERERERERGSDIVSAYANVFWNNVHIHL
jgi:hypothetical protein